MTTENKKTLHHKYTRGKSHLILHVCQQQCPNDRQLVNEQIAYSRMSTFELGVLFGSAGVWIHFRLSNTG